MEVKFISASCFPHFFLSLECFEERAISNLLDFEDKRACKVRPDRIRSMKVLLILGFRWRAAKRQHRCNQ